MAEIIRNALAQRTSHEAEGPRPLSRPVESPEPFPVAALGPMQSAALALQAYTRAPMAICAQAVLGAVALVGQAHADVALPSGQTRPLSLFLLTVAASGERKSAVDALALGPIYKREAVRDNWRAEMKEFEVGSGPEPPLTPVLVCTEPTFEGYCKLTAHGLPALLFSAEGGSFIGGFGMSADQKLKTAAGISSVWDGDPIKRVRAGDGSIVLAGRRLSMHLMAQPDVAAQLLGDELLISQGLMSRVLVSAPESTAGTRFFEEPKEPARIALANYSKRLSDMLAAPQPLRDGTRNELEPRELPLSGEAHRIWIGFHDHVEARLGQDGELAPIAGLANKAAEHAARLAGLLTLWSDINAAAIPAEAMAHATLLMQYYLAEGLRLRGASATNPHLRLTQRVLEWVLSRWSEPAIYPAAVYNDCPIRVVRDQKTARRIIATLEEHGWLTRLDDGARIRGARRREAWLIHGRTL